MYLFHESKMCSSTMFTVNSLKCNFHFMPVPTLLKEVLFAFYTNTV